MAKPRGRGRIKKKKGGAPAPRKRRPLLSAEELDWKNVSSLRRFLSERGKLRSRRITGLSRRQQTQLAQAVKRARIMGLLAYPDQDRSVKAHRAASGVSAGVPEGVEGVADEVLVEEIIEVEGDGTELVDAEVIEVIEEIEEPVAVGAGDPEDAEA
ncbi:MAG: 30S ribosomal protein S18 [Actinomycetota bacterium]